MVVLEWIILCGCIYLCAHIYLSSSMVIFEWNSKWRPVRCLGSLLCFQWLSLYLLIIKLLADSVFVFFIFCVFILSTILWCALDHVMYKFTYPQYGLTCCLNKTKLSSFWFANSPNFNEFQIMNTKNVFSRFCLTKIQPCLHNEQSTTHYYYRCEWNEWIIECCREAWRE